jgi:uncharacterized protein (TIGR00369 family)
MTQTQAVDAVRHREHSWTDPSATVAALADRAGIDVLSGMIAGELPPPPVASLVDFTVDEVEVGRAVFSMVPSEMHYNPLGTVHGGVIATLLDSAAGCAVQSTLARGTGYTTVDLHTTYLRPVSAASGRVTAEGSVISRGSRTALAEARLTDSRGRLLAHATSTCMLFEVGTTGPTA